MSRYGHGADISGSIIVGGEAELGSGDDDIDIDAGTLFIDADNNRVGIGTESPDYAFHVAGNMGVNEYVYHNGDSNTYLRFQDDDINLNCGGKSMVKMSEQPSAQDVVIINNGNNDVDFKIKDDSGNVSFHADAEYGSIGIGGDASINALTVVENRHADVAASFYNDGDDQYRYGISIKCGTDAGTASRAVRFYDGDGDEVGYISWSGGAITYATFTGGHEAAVESSNYSAGQHAYTYGTLVKVVSTSAGNRAKQVNYVIGATTSAKDKTVFGIYACNLDPQEIIGQNTDHQVFAVGDGHVLVCSEGGDIEIGDYICSSNTSGHGMKQDDDLLHNYTVAKATEAVDWASEGQNTKLISCTYHAA
jgi:hypothetical protein